MLNRTMKTLAAFLAALAVVGIVGNAFGAFAQTPIPPPPVPSPYPPQVQKSTVIQGRLLEKGNWAPLSNEKFHSYVELRYNHPSWGWVPVSSTHSDRGMPPRWDGLFEIQMYDFAPGSYVVVGIADGHEVNELKLTIPTSAEGRETYAGELVLPQSNVISVELLNLTLTGRKLTWSVRVKKQHTDKVAAKVDNQIYSNSAHGNLMYWGYNMNPVKETFSESTETRDYSQEIMDVLKENSQLCVSVAVGSAEKTLTGYGYASVCITVK